MTVEKAPIYLGVCHRAEKQKGLWNIMGLTEHVAAPFFPLRFPGFGMAIALPIATAVSGEVRHWHFRFVDESDASKFFDLIYDQKVADSDSTTPAEVVVAGNVQKPPQVDRDTDYTIGHSAIATTDIGSYFLAVLPLPSVKLGGPGTLFVDWVKDTSTERLGLIRFDFVRPPPITESERIALLRLPTASHTVCTTLKCEQCEANFSIYSTLYPSRPPTVPPDAITVSNAPESWECSCGAKTGLDLRYLKAGMHQVHRWPKQLVALDSQELTPAYEHSRTQQIISRYSEIIGGHPREEDVQKYLEANPIFWSFLSPQLVLQKPRILSKHVADFAVLSSTRILWFVEIEKPQTVLVNQSGKRSAELEAGFHQIRDWQFTIDEHRGACLSELNIRPEDVHDIRYVLIAGLAAATTPKGMLQLRRDRLKDTELFAFDELASFLHMTATALARL